MQRRVVPREQLTLRLNPSGDKARYPRLSATSRVGRRHQEMRGESVSQSVSRRIAVWIGNEGPGAPVRQPELLVY